MRSVTFLSAALLRLKVGLSDNYDLSSQVTAFNGITARFGFFPNNHRNIFSAVVDNYSELFGPHIVIATHNSTVYMEEFRERLSTKGFERI